MTRGEFERRLVEVLPRLRKQAVKLTRNAAEADDVVQATAERALQKRSLFVARDDAESNFRAWIHTVLFNEFVNRRRRGKRHADVPLEDAPEPWRPASQDKGIELREAFAALNALPKQERDMLLAGAHSSLAGMIAVFGEGIAAGTVKSRLFRARQRLRELVEGVA